MAVPPIEADYVHFEVTGNGPAVVFAHGLGGNQMSWWQQVGELHRWFTCIAFAHRGFHPSGGEAEPATYADNLEDLLDYLQIEQAALVGQSMGGWTCVDFAIRHPERVRRMVLADTTGCIRFPEEDGTSLGDGSAAAALVEAGIHPACGRRMAREQPALHHLYRQIDSLGRRVDKAAVMLELRRLRVVPPERLAATGIPLMWIWGAEDVVLPPSLAELARKHFPKARIEVVPEAGHSVYWERAPEFNRLLLEFLSKF